MESDLLMIHQIAFHLHNHNLNEAIDMLQLASDESMVGVTLILDSDEKEAIHVERIVYKKMRLVDRLLILLPIRREILLHWPCKSALSAASCLSE